MNIEIPSSVQLSRSANARRLVEPSDSELERAFARDVALWVPPIHVNPNWIDGYGEIQIEAPPPAPRYCSSFDLVLPFLEARPQGWMCARGERGDYSVSVYEWGHVVHRVEAEGLARCAMIALLRSAGWTIEFSRT